MSWRSQSRWFDTLEMVAGGLSSVAAIIAITATLGMVGGLGLQIAGGLALAFGILMGFIKLRKAWRLTDHRLNIFGQRLHSLTHCIRDAFGQLQVWAGTPELDENGLFLHARNTAQKCVDDLAKILTESSGQEIIATLQYFRGPGNGGPRYPIDPRQIQVETLARSNNCPNCDVRVNSVTLSDHDAYREIVSDGRHQFVAPNLESFCEDYERSHGAPFRLGNLQHHLAYKGLIVIPIRIAEEFFKAKAEKNKFRIIGFISLDSMSVDAFREDHIRAYCGLGKSCADSMFHYLHLVDRLHESLQQGKAAPLDPNRPSYLRAMKGEA